jgi:hypothetical protein
MNDAAPLKPEPFVLKGVTLHYASLFKPYVSPAPFRPEDGKEQGRYGVSFKHDALPDWARPLFRPRERDWLVTATSSFAPVIFPTSMPIFRAVVADAEDCRIPLDRLLRDFPADVKCNVWENHRGGEVVGNGTFRIPHHGLGIMAVRLDSGALNKALRAFLSAALDIEEES